ncbi:hypothetical protein [Sorangium sp. So ce1182]|uniref:hypothetical protein n=1 Tax=Sorangium sp. So ce1182 TaxID=3133334 RepID=UPI003F62E0C9
MLKSYDHVTHPRERGGPNKPLLPTWQALLDDRELARRMPGPRNPSEFLLDLTHVEIAPMPVRTGHGQSPWVHRVRLGLESEWGHATSPSYNIKRVLYDASKLAAVRADAKVMIFGSTNRENHDDIVESLQLQQQRWRTARLQKCGVRRITART